MRSKIGALAMLVAATATGSLAAHSEDRQMPGQAAGAPSNMQLATACVQSEQRTLAILGQVSRRLDAAHRTDSPAEARTAIDDLQTALNQMRMATEACVGAPAAAEPRVAAAKPATAMDHAAMGHAAPAIKPAELDPQLVSACAQGQQQVTALANRLNRTLERARQTNAAAEMHASIAALPAALVEARAALQKCEPLRTAMAAADATAASAAAVAMDHSKMAMPVAPAPASAQPTKAATPAAPMDHSKMTMGAATPTTKPPAAAGAKTTKPPAPAAGVDHTAIKMDTPKLPVLPAPRIADPACPNNITQANAPKAVYQRKVYFFCSTADRDLFRKDPAGYLKKRPR